MKKRNYSLVVALLFVAVLTAVVVFNTVAKYTSTVSNSGTATVAKWNFVGDNTADESFEINIAETVDESTLIEDRIAPGTSGHFDIVVTNTSEVGANVTVALGALTASGNDGVVPSGLKFYTDGTYTTEINANNAGTFTKNGTLAAKTGNETPTLTLSVYWRWQYEVNNDSADTTAGTAGSTLTIPVTITGTQVQPSATEISTEWAA